MELLGNPSLVVDEGTNSVEESLEANGGLAEVRPLTGRALSSGVRTQWGGSSRLVVVPVVWYLLERSLVLDLLGIGGRWNGRVGGLLVLDGGRWGFCPFVMGL